VPSSQKDPTLSSLRSDVPPHKGEELITIEEMGR
jgi:hypothetical protein